MRTGSKLDACVERALATLPAEVRRHFAEDAHAALADDLGMTVRAVAQLAKTRSDGGACDGISFLEDGVILYAPTPESRRENFTLAHELGHWLVDKTPSIYDWLGDQENPQELLETVCDRIAQSLLLPDDLVSAVIGAGPIRAQHLLDLFATTQASEPVCGIGLSKQLPGLGAVVIVERFSKQLLYASVKPDEQRGWPTVFPWPGQSLSTGHALLRVTPGANLTRRLPWQTQWGAEADFYVDAVGGDKRVFAVFSSGDLWKSEVFHPELERSFDTRPLLRGRCCGVPFEVRGYPCPTCHEPFCPKCSRCGCQRESAKELTCTQCWQRFRKHLVVGGVCVSCRE